MFKLIKTNSIPKFQKWEYMHEPPKKSDESKLLEILRNPKDWIPIDEAETKSEKEGKKESSS